MNTGPMCAAAQRTAHLVEASSQGLITVKVGRAQASAVSSRLICEGPSSPIEMPEWVPTSFRLTFG